MRILKVLTILSAMVISASLTFASDTFYKTNSDLRRVGLDEIRAMGSIGFESGNYRLDPDFRLGYGDTLTVNFWGKLEASHEVNIDRDGNIVIPLLGKVSIIGLTLAEARTAIQRELDNKYTNVELDLNLADVQDIRVAVLGYVTKPGPYAVSPFCRIVEVIAKAGGPNKNGSLSDIRLIRDEKVVASFNAYDFIFKGDQSQNARVKNGDLIYIPETKNLIAVRGDVRYPGIYEADSSTLSKVISVAGGITPTKHRRKVSILRAVPGTGAIVVFKDVIFDPTEGVRPQDDITLENYDSIIITTDLDYIPAHRDLYKVVHISGEVENPGSYLIKDNEELSSLLKRTGGLRETAFIQGAVFTRDSLKESQEPILNELTKAQEIAILKGEAFLAEAILTQQEKEMRLKALEYKRKALNLMAARPLENRIIINLQDIIEGKSDIILEKEDRLYIPPVPDWVMVAGAVYNPKSIVFVKGEAAGYYINAVGGPTKFADKDDIYIIKASGRTESKSTGYGEISRGDIIVVPAKADWTLLSQT